MEENKNIEQEISEELDNEELSSCISTNDTYFETPILIDEQLYSDSDEFHKGVEIGMKYAGIYSALVSDGMSTQSANELILTLIAVENNRDIAEINKEATIESVKVKNDIDDGNRL